MFSDESSKYYFNINQQVSNVHVCVFRPRNIHFHPIHPAQTLSWTMRRKIWHIIFANPIMHNIIKRIRNNIIGMYTTFSEVNVKMYNR